MFASQPFVRFLVPLVVGIVLIQFGFENRVFDSVEWVYNLVIISASLVFLFGIGLLFFRSHRYVRSFLLFFALFWLGICTASLRINAFQKDIGQLENQDYDGLVLQINSLGQQKRASIQYDGRLVSIRTKAGWVAKNAKVLISLSASSQVNLAPGTTLLVKNRNLSLPKGAMNPDEFDYRKYLQKLGIGWTLYIADTSFVVLPQGASTSFNQWPLSISERADAVFKKFLPEKSSYGLIKAMLLGRRGDLGNDLLDSYIASGAVHVLAVSGLHVGVLFLLISFLLGWLRKRKWGSYLYLTVIVLFLVIYALMTGLSPSVVRASLMCVTFAASQTFLRRHNGLNTLALSAFIILLLDPFACYSVGFQLSYAAVAGIVLAYPLLKNTFNPNNKVLRWVWQISLVGFVAQLFTFPISIYYFHQFPVYFWLVNPFAIALTSLLIYGAIGVLALSFLSFDPLTSLVANLLSIVARLMNTIVQIPRKLPMYLLENLSFDLLEVVLVFLIILAVYHLIKGREYSSLKWVLMLSVLFLQYSVWKLILDFSTPDMNFHAISRHSVVSMTNGQRGYILSNAAFERDSMAYATHIKNYFVNRGIRSVRYYTLPESAVNQPLKLRQGSTFNLDWDAHSEEDRASMVIIRNKKYPTPAFSFPQSTTRFILSPELGYRTKERWKVLLNDAKLPFIDPAETGTVHLPK